MDFSTRHYAFIKSEFNITEEQLRRLDDDALAELYDNVLEIEIDETWIADNKPLSERGESAVEIVNIMAEALGYAQDDWIGCPVCGKYERDFDLDICEVCGWENDGTQPVDPDYNGGENGEKAMTTWKELREEILSDPEVKAEYDALEPEFAIIRALTEARNLSGLTQEQLSSRTGIKQGDISKIERGVANPSLKTLKRLARGMDKTLRIEFVDEMRTV